ncbi:MAG: hypothetical protein Nk1A_7580 [Endomicrobiia bacterium]|nr:MAG: hypothetical protein Nk1A_7580 [Endomicrobiia bacterium]
MKKGILILLWLAIVLTTTISTSKVVVFASDDFAEKLQTNISAKGTFILQTANIGNEYNGIYNTYTTSLGITKELGDNAKITVNLKGGNGKVGDDHLATASYATINKDASSKDLYVEVIYHHESFLCDRFNIDLGKFGISKYFDKNIYADDTSTQFLTGSFVSNKTIENLGDRSLGLRANYTLDKFDIDYGYFSYMNDKFDSKGFNILQINYKPSKKENYRVYGWMDNGNTPEKDKPRGIGVSLDREINKQVGVFTRFGYKDLSVLWSVGTQIKGSSWSRTNDTIGLATGQIYKKEYTSDNKRHPETQIELYYKLAINDNLAISPVLQYVAHPKGEAKENLFIYGMRTHFRF